MRTWRDLTLQDALTKLGRYRALVLTLLSVALIAVLVPGIDRTQAPTDGSSVRAVAPLQAESRAGADRVAQQGSVETAVSPSTGAGSAASVARSPGEAIGTAVPERPTAALGEALAAPDCDRNTGRIKMPVVYVLYAPDCVPIWPKGRDNGGATWQGVTGDTIKIAIYVPQETGNTDQAGAIFAATGYEDPTTDEEDDVNRQKVVDAYHAHFETYGRKVEYVQVEASGPPTDDASAKADAIRVATEIKAFASLRDPSLSGGVNAYIEELVARGVMCIRCTPGQPQHNFMRWDPFVFSDLTSTHQIFVHNAEYFGKRVAGRPAKYAGDPLFQTRTRTLGLVMYNTADHIYDDMPGFMDEQLGRYGTKLNSIVYQTFDLSAAQEQARVIIAKMKDSGITTVMCYCDPFSPVFYTQEATRQQYFPEWGLVAANAIDLTLFGRLYDQAQWAHAFGVAKFPARMDPSIEENEVNLVSWHYGQELDSYPDFVDFGLLFTGLHLAGPNLTPTSFRDGMFAMKPVSGYITRAAVSYGNWGLWPWEKDFHAQDDMTELWWDAAATGPDEIGAEGQGMYRYVDMGKRYLPGEWPATEVNAFDPANTVMVYEERPPQDVFPVPDHEDHRVVP